MDRQVSGHGEGRAQEAYGAVTQHLTTLASDARAPAARDRKPGQGAAHASRPRTLGRGAAAQRRRGRRNAAALRLPGAGVRLATPTARCSVPTSSSGFPAASRSCRRREGAARRIPRRLRVRGRRPARRASREPRAPGARSPRQAGARSVLAAVRAVARLRDHVRPRRDASSGSPRSRTRSLSEDGWKLGVILASPSTLFTLLRTVAATLAAGDRRRRAHARSTSSGASCTARIATMAKHLGDAGKALDNAVGALQLGGRLARDARPRRRRGASSSTASRATFPSPQPIERQARPLQAPELVEPGEQLRAIDAA